MGRRITGVLLTLVMLLLAACIQPAGQDTANADSSTSSFDAEAVKARIAGINANLVEGMSVADIDLIMSTYADDAVLFPPGADMQEGAENTRAFWQGLLDMGSATVELQDIDTWVSAEIAYNTGSYHLKVETADGDLVEQSGNYLIVLMPQEDGSWKITRDIFNKR